MPVSLSRYNAALDEVGVDSANLEPRTRVWLAIPEDGGSEAAAAVGIGIAVEAAAGKRLAAARNLAGSDVGTPER